MPKTQDKTRTQTNTQTHEQSHEKTNMQTNTQNNKNRQQKMTNQGNDCKQTRRHQRQGQTQQLLKKQQMPNHRE